MTPARRIRTIRRPSIVILVVGTAALASVPPSAGLLAGPATVASAPADEDVIAGLLSSATPLTPAERARRDPGSEPLRYNPVAFRLAAAPAAPAPGAVPDLPLITTTAKPGTAAAAAIEFALAQRGLPYVWGGNGPQQGDAGFDCSGLTTAAYAYAGIRLPRTAHTQYYAGPHVPAGAALEPGDLVFYGVPQRVHHVGLYIGDGRMVAAPTFGKPVRLSYVRYPGDDYLGATRPAAGRDAGPLDSGLLATPDLPVEVPPTPDPAVPPAPEEFLAPEVPVEDIPVEVTAPPEETTGEPTETPMALADGEPTESQAPEVDAPTTPESTTPETTPAATPTTTPEATPTETPPPAPESVDPGPPTALTLPDGTELTLVAAERGENGLPVTPTEPGTGGMRFGPAEDDGAARARVSLHPDTPTEALVPGAVILVRAADGSAVELTVRSRDTVDPDTAADLASGRGDTLRVVLLRTDPDTGEVLVVIAE